ncbi:MAG TPA: AI-2E family transporter [Chitinophagaceae bacterium]|nr:AI-2E family transporter [Chitinophagaceae bacterium]HNF72086.1 AI-2E family transporter [Chitinophagaceae bacterium]
MSRSIHPNTIRQLLFLLVLLLLAVLIGSRMYIFLGAFLGAVTLYVLLRNYMHQLVNRFRWKRSLAALFIIFAVLLAIVIPSTLLANYTLHRINPLFSHPEIMNQNLKVIHDYLLTHYQIDVFNASLLSKINATVFPALQQVLGGTMNALGNLFLMLFILYFMLTGSVTMELWLRNHVPFKHGNVNLVISEFRSLVYSNAIGIPMVAAVQGLAGMAGYWIFGSDEWLMMGLLTAICSVIPVVGSMLIYIPLGVYALATGSVFNGWGILLWGFIVIGSIDNVARFVIQKRIADVHPLITFFGVVIGINLFGFLGIIFGPLLLSMFVLLVKIYTDEFGAHASE